MKILLYHQVGQGEYVLYQILSFTWPCLSISCSYDQGRIYVASEHPTCARTMFIVCDERRILCPITLNRRQNLSVLMKNMPILG